MDEFEMLLQAAIKGRAQELEQLVQDKPEVLYQTTEAGNTCLHIAALCGHGDFCNKVLALRLTQEPSLPSSLLSTANDDGETPLLVAVKSGRVSLALDLLEQHSRHELLDEHLLKRDRHGCNVLHHAIRNGYEGLALRLIGRQPALSESRNGRGESPMFIAVLKGFRSVYMALLSNERSQYSGANGSNALHAAVKYGDQGTCCRCLLFMHFSPLFVSCLKAKTAKLTCFFRFRRTTCGQASREGQSAGETSGQ
jgi:ankyrin repeat protein